MKNNNYLLLFYNIVIFLFLIIGCLQIWQMYVFTNLRQEVELLNKYEDLNERLEMYNKDIKNTLMMTGVYHHDGFYCVWTKNRTQDLIKETDYHEMCHAFVHEDNKHFCDYKFIKW